VGAATTEWVGGPFVAAVVAGGDADSGGSRRLAELQLRLQRQELDHRRRREDLEW
jgi:hypothetical protein